MKKAEPPRADDGVPARLTRTFDMTTAGSVPLFRQALGDLKRSITNSADMGFHCYRAVECLVNFVRETRRITDKKAAIAALEGELKLDSGCIEVLHRLGSKVRHGNVGWISGEERTQAIKIAREIILRFAAVQNATPGAAPTFEELKP